MIARFVFIGSTFLVLSGCGWIFTKPSPELAPEDEVTAYTVTYAANGAVGGSVPEDNDKYRDGDTATVLANSGSLHKVPAAGTAEAFKFTGWNTKADGSGLSYTAGVTFDVTADITLYAEWGPFLLRDTGPGGGLIFHDKGSFSSGWRYLEAAPQTTEINSKEWGIYSDAAEGADDIAIGGGAANTADLIADYGGGGSMYAFQVAAALSHNGYSDWFLPSRGGLNEMYKELKTNGVGGFGELTTGAHRKLMPIWRFI